MFAIDIEFLRGIYDAGGASDADAPEWPPHPARLFNALVAAADHDDVAELGALSWFETLGAPEILASVETRSCGERSSFVPTNQLEKSNTYGRFVARKALGPRSWTALSPRNPRISIIWPDEPDSTTLASLKRVAHRVSYLGRSTSSVSCNVRVGVGRGDDDERHVWCPSESPSSVPVELPHPGYLNELVHAYQGGRRAHEVARRVVGYSVRAADPGPVVVAPSPYGEVIVLGFANGRRIGANQIVAVSATLREAIQSHIGGGPVVLRGHRRSEVGAEPIRHQIAIAALPFVDHPHASGQALGLAVLLPSEISADDRHAVLGGLSKVVRNGLTLGKLGLVGLDPGPHSAETLQQDRWKHASNTWVSVTPISCNRFFTKPTAAQLETDLRNSVRHLDLPDPLTVEISRAPMISGAQWVSPWARLRHSGDRATPSYHAEVTFPVLVSGPLLLGSMRRYGLGLMLPRRPDRGGS